MKFRNTVQLGALLAFLVILYFGWQMLQSESARLAQEAKKIFDFAPADIRELSVDRLDEEPTVGVRDDEGNWSITAPHPSIRPNEVLWDRVAEQAAALKNERTLPGDALALEDYGLGTPRLTIGLEAGGAEHTLRFGYLEPTQTFRYARMDDGPVFLVKKDAVFELDRPLDLLRQAYIVDNHEAPVLRLEFARIMTEELLETMDNPPAPGTESDVILTVERPSADEPWVQLTPVRAAANQERVNELVREIQHARGRHYVDDPESFADYGLDPAGARMTIENGAETGGRQTFYFGDVAQMADDGGIWVRKEGEPAVFIIDAHVQTLFPRINALRERRLMTRQVGDYQRIAYTGADTAFTLARNPDRDGAWEMVDPPLDDTDEVYVSQYISALKSIEGVQFYPGEPAEYGLDEPRVRLRFSGGEAEEASEIRLTPDPEDPDRYYALTDAGEVTAVPADRVGFLLGGPQQFRHMSLLRFPAARAEKMAFQLGEVDYVLEKAHNRWLVTVPEHHFLPNQQDARTLLQAVSGLRAVAAEGEPDTDTAAAEYGFEAPRFTFEVTLTPEVAGEPAETLGPLEVGAVVPGIDDQRFARSPARSGVFRIRQSFVEQVRSAVSGIQRQGGGR